MATLTLAVLTMPIAHFGLTSSPCLGRSRLPSLLRPVQDLVCPCHRSCSTVEMTIKNSNLSNQLLATALGIRCCFLLGFFTTATVIDAHCIRSQRRSCSCREYRETDQARITQCMTAKTYNKKTILSISVAEDGYAAAANDGTAALQSSSASMEPFPYMPFLTQSLCTCC